MIDMLNYSVAENRNRGIEKGTLDLWSAVLFSGIRNACKFSLEMHDFDDISKSKNRLDYHWVMTSKSTGVGSFIWICNVLDINAQKVREMVDNSERAAFIADRYTRWTKGISRKDFGKKRTKLKN